MVSDEHASSNEKNDLSILPFLLQTISAYIGSRLSGKVLATFVRGNLVYNEGKHALACGSPILATL